MAPNDGNPANRTFRHHKREYYEQSGVLVYAKRHYQSLGTWCCTGANCLCSDNRANRAFCHAKDCTAPPSEEFMALQAAAQAKVRAELSGTSPSVATPPKRGRPPGATASPKAKPKAKAQDSSKLKAENAKLKAEVAKLQKNPGTQTTVDLDESDKEAAVSLKSLEKQLGAARQTLAGDPNEPALVAYVASLEQKVDAAKPKTVVKASQLHAKVEALQRQVAKATNDIQAKHDLCEKIKGEALDLCDAIHSKNLEIDKLNEEISKTVLLPPLPAQPPQPQLQPSPLSIDQAPDLLTLVHSQFSDYQTARNTFNFSEPLKAQLDHFSTNWPTVEAVFRSMCSIRQQATAEIELQTGIKVHVAAPPLSPERTSEAPAARPEDTPATPAASTTAASTSPTGTAPPPDPAATAPAPTTALPVDTVLEPPVPPPRPLFADVVTGANPAPLPNTMSVDAPSKRKSGETSPEVNDLFQMAKNRREQGRDKASPTLHESEDMDESTA